MNDNPLDTSFWLRHIWGTSLQMKPIGIHHCEWDTLGYITLKENPWYTSLWMRHIGIYHCERDIGTHPCEWDTLRYITVNETLGYVTVNWMRHIGIHHFACDTFSVVHRSQSFALHDRCVDIRHKDVTVSEWVGETDCNTSPSMGSWPSQTS